MQTFCGDRTIDGVKVTVDGRPLDQQAGPASLHGERL